MIEANGKSPPYFIKRLHEGCAAVACLLLSGIFLSCHPTPKGALDPETVGRLSLPIDADPEFAERLGREALVKIGYLPLLNLARQAGWVTTKTLVRPPGNNGGLLAMDGAVDARGFIDVFSKYAVAAGVASQADSLFPGPGDVVGIGIVVIGLIDAGLLAGILLDALGDVASPATNSTTPSPPVATTKPTATAVPTVDVPPLPRETCETMYPSIRTCSSLPDEYTFPSAKATLARMKDAFGDKNLRLHNEEPTESGPCPDIGTHYNVRQGKGRAGSLESVSKLVTY